MKTSVNEVKRLVKEKMKEVIHLDEEELQKRLAEIQGGATRVYWLATVANVIRILLGLPYYLLISAVTILCLPLTFLEAAIVVLVGRVVTRHMDILVEQEALQICLEAQKKGSIDLALLRMLAQAQKEQQEVEDA